VAALALAVVLAGCDAPRRAPADSPAVPATRPATTGPSAPPLRLATRSDGTKTGNVDGILVEVGVPPTDYGACQPEDVLAVLRDMTDAIAGNPARAASFAKTGFQWYSATENGDEVVPDRHAVLRDAASLRAYLEQRQRRHERLRLIALRVIGDGNFALQLVRVADDLAPSLGGRHHVAEGKGKVDCANRSIIAFSHAMFPGEPDYASWRGLFGNVSARRFEAAATAAASELQRGA
jgi:hypothetical protein